MQLCDVLPSLDLHLHLHAADSSQESPRHVVTATLTPALSAHLSYLPRLIKLTQVLLRSVASERE